MLTSFDLVVPKHNNIFLKILGGKVRVEYNKCGDLALKRVIYISPDGKIRPKKLYKFINKGETVLANEGVTLPDGVIRYCNNRFSEKLCVNYALDVLRNMENPAELKLGIYDPDGNSPELLFEALKLVRSPLTVTYNLLPYDRVRYRALRELGASALITHNTNELYNCDFIAAPTRISAYIPVKDSAVLLTAGKPYIKLGGRITYKYDVELPPEIEAIRPPELGREYFGSAFFK